MAPDTLELPRDTWRSYFDDFSKTLVAAEATVEVDGQDLGAQILAERLVLTGVTYDNKDDIVVIGLDAPGGDPEDYEHIVSAPKRIFVAAGDGLEVETAIDIEDAEDHRTIVRVRPVPELPGE